jgi:hypothetical protein
VAGDRRGALERSTVDEVGRDPRRPAGVAAEVAADAGRCRPLLDDPERRAAGQSVAGELAALAGDRLKERGLRGLPDGGRLEVGVERFGGAAVDRCSGPGSDW